MLDATGSATESGCIGAPCRSSAVKRPAKQIAGAVRYSVQLLDLADKRASFSDEHVGQFGSPRWNGRRRELRSSKDTGSGDRVLTDCTSTPDSHASSNRFGVNTSATGTSVSRTATAAASSM